MIFLQYLIEAVGLRIFLLDLGELQVDYISAKIRYCRKYKEIYINQVNQALSRCFFSIFSENYGKGISAVFRLSIMRLLPYK